MNLIISLSLVPGNKKDPTYRLTLSWLGSIRQVLLVFFSFMDFSVTNVTAKQVTLMVLCQIRHFSRLQPYSVVFLFTCSNLPRRFYHLQCLWLRHPWHLLVQGRFPCISHIVFQSLNWVWLASTSFRSSDK